MSVSITNTHKYVKCQNTHALFFFTNQICSDMLSEISSIFCKLLPKLISKEKKTALVQIRNSHSLKQNAISKPAVNHPLELNDYRFT